MRQRTAELVADRDGLLSLLAAERQSAHSIALVPTMGALHAGHLALVEAAGAAHDFVVCSVFVNPLQFDEPADLDRYPRDLEGDLAVAAAAGADVVFAPTPGAFHLVGEPQVSVDPGPLGAVLEGAHRPGHLGGVATLVTALFALAWPDAAYFGEKDYQQLLLVRLLAADLGFPLEVVAVATRREEDGLALSSRNARLSPDERHVAPVLYETLRAGRDLLDAGAPVKVAEGEMAARLAAAPGVVTDYAVVRDAADLGPVDAATKAIRLLVAARLGEVRLIDNLGWKR